MSEFTSANIIYGGRGNGMSLADLHERGYFDVKCKTPTDIKDRLAEFSEALNTLDGADIYDVAKYLCGYSYFELEYQGESLPSSKSALLNYKREFEGTEYWPAFIQGMKTALLRQRLAELKEEVYTHTRNMYNAEFLKMNHLNMSKMRAAYTAIHESVEKLTLENISTA